MLLRLEIGAAAARTAILLYWAGLLTSLFRLGWAAGGGVLLGPISDRYGRKRVPMTTMLLRKTISTTGFESRTRRHAAHASGCEALGSSFDARCPLSPWRLRP